ncbi:MAG: hypothetical protein QOK31_240, partial [Solirubrobacteraceae bacterium]|nr:hypothetical protein [Solirubrobacteraceae bacterium]
MPPPCETCPVPPCALLEPEPAVPVCPGLVPDRPGAVPAAGRRLVAGGVPEWPGVVAVGDDTDGEDATFVGAVVPDRDERPPEVVPTAGADP